MLKEKLEKYKKRNEKLESIFKQNYEEMYYEDSYCICPKPAPYITKYNDENFDYRKNSSISLNYSINISKDNQNVKNNFQKLSKENHQRHSIDVKSLSTYCNSMSSRSNYLVTK